VVEAFAALADLATGAHPGHARMLARWAVLVGSELGLGTDDLADVAVAARLHDLGQAGVPDRILHKPGPLDEAEWAAVRRHAVLGAEVLALVPHLEGAALLVRHHHERWDGRGHPDGLVGDAIPLGARVIAVCEALGALLTDPPLPAALRASDRARRARGRGRGPIRPGVGVGPAAGGVPDDEPTPPLAVRRGGPGDRAADADGHGRRPTGLRVIRAFARLERLPASTGRAGDSSRWSRRHRTAGRPRPRRRSTPTSPHGRGDRPGRTRRPPARATAGVRDASGRSAPRGLREVLELVGDIGVFERVPGWESTLEQFRLHAVATQQAAEQVVQALGDEPTDELSVGALLHDVGKLVLATAHTHYPSAVHPPGATPEVRVVAERRLLGVDHAVAGGVMGRRWRLPAGVVRMIELHHDREASGDVAIVRLADMLAHHGHGRAIDASELTAAASALGLGAAALRSLMHELPQAGARARPDAPSLLSGRETDVLRGLAAGHAYARIASDLGVSLSTVRTHALTAGGKLGTTSRTQTVLAATAAGWI
jgi:putative nucleotidyltransferase with HDIG domain